MPKGGPRKSNASTPLPGESDTPNLPVRPVLLLHLPPPFLAGPTLTGVQTTADRLSFADYPRPFRNPHFASRLHLRVASSTTAAKKNAKQILTLERERYAGGDGFLSAYQTGQKARGEPIDVGSKKRKGPPGVGPTGEKAKRGDNLRGRGKKAAAAAAAAAGGTETPGGTEGGGSASGRGTPVPGYADGEEDDDEEGDEGEAKRLEGLGIGGSTGTRGGKEIITCQCHWSRTVAGHRQPADERRRPHAHRSAVPAAHAQVLRHHRPPRAVHGPTHKAAVQGSGGVACRARSRQYYTRLHTNRQAALIASRVPEATRLISPYGERRLRSNSSDEDVSACTHRCCIAVCISARHV